MHHFVRRALVTAGATAGIIGLTATSAAAHFCFREDLNPRAAAANAGSPNWRTVDSLLAEFLPDLCPAGAAYFKESIGANGDELINQHGVMAGGNVKQGKDNPAIDHLAFPETDAEFGALVGASMALC